MEGEGGRKEEKSSPFPASSDLFQSDQRRVQRASKTLISSSNGMDVESGASAWSPFEPERRKGEEGREGESRVESNKKS